MSYMRSWFHIARDTRSRRTAAVLPWQLATGDG
jgi:hypothetical protein